MIDLHCHVLPGIDDGPETIDESLELARAAAACGVRTLVATPHVSWRYQNDADAIGRLVDELGRQMAAERIELQVLAGAEIAVTRVPEIESSELARLSLGGGEWLLVEPPFTPVASGLEAMLQDLLRQGHRILLAHPERCPAFQRDPRMLGSLVGEGILASLTAGSLVGRFGGLTRRFALKLVQEEMVHNVASDAHDLSGRAPGISSELEQAGLAPLEEWLTQAVPAAILSGDEIPPRPSLQRPGALKRAWSRR